MSYDSDPPRLSELGSDTSPELRGLFQNARRDVPSDAQLERMLTRLGPVIGAGIGLASDAVRAGAQQAAQASGSSIPAFAKLAAVLGGVGIIAAGSALWSAKHHEAKPNAIVQAASPHSAQAAAAATPNPSEQGVAPTSGASVASEAAPAAVPKAGRVDTGDSVQAEAELLERARASSTSDPNKALGLTREHARRFPHGLLAQEREVIAIEALRHLGRQTEADARAERFRQAYPGSAHQHALENSAPER